MRLFKQVDYLDCGLSTIQIFHHYYFHKIIDLEKLRDLVNFDKNGINLLTIKDVASQYGLLFNSFIAELEDIWKAKIKKPFIISILSNKYKHFVIVKKVFKNKVLILDPAKGKYFLTKVELAKKFANVLVIVEKILDKSKKNQSKNKVLEIILQNMNFILLITLLSIFQIVFNVVSSFYIKIILDSIIPNMISDTLKIISLCFSFLVIMKTINYIFKNYLLSYVKINIHSSLSSSYLVAYLHTNNLQRNKISNPEYIRRISQIDNIISYYLNVINSIIVDSLLFVIIGSILIFISLKIFLISIGTIFITFMASLLNSWLISNKSSQFINGQKNMSLSFYNAILLRGSANNLKLRLETEKRFSKNILKMAKLSMKINTYNWFYDFFALLINHLLPILITYISVMFIFSNEMSIGNMMLFLSLISYLTSPIEKLGNIIMSYPKIKILTREINYVLNYTKLKNNYKGYYDNLENIKIQDFKFALQKGKNIINIKNMNFSNSIQIIGPSGSGKTTLLNALAGNLKNEGILGNNIPLKEWNLKEYKEQIFYEASEYIPNITLGKFILGNNYENIKMFMENISKISYDLPFKLSLDDELENNLSNFSSGQQQIIRLLPLLANKYRYIILDESMNNIDPNFRNKFLDTIMDFQDQAKFIVVEHNYDFNFKKVSINEFNKI